MQTKLIVLQPTPLCNLNCSYCYLPNRRDPSKMEESLLERVFSLALSSSLVQGEIEFLWHAGEPLTVGVSYFDRAMDLISRTNVRNLRVLNTIQTNAILINDQWANFLARNGFAVGVSLDGPGWIHDAKRRRWSGEGTHGQAMRGVETLRSHGIFPGVICVLTRDSLAHPEEIFNFFLDNEFEAVGFNVEEVENAHTVSSLQHERAVREYRNFFGRLFDLWWPHRAVMKIREFDDFGQVFLNYLKDPSYVRPVLETEPLGIMTVQQNGDISTFSPEFAGMEVAEFGSFVIGNAWSLSSLEELASVAPLKEILREVQASVDLCHSTCEYFSVCGGEFLSNKFSEHGTLRATETSSCLLHRKVLASLLIEKLGSRPWPFESERNSHVDA